MTNVLNGNGRMPLLNKEQFEAEFQRLILNATSMRGELIRRYMAMDGPNRNLNAECGYPEALPIDPWFFRDLYDREPVATRVVELMPKECWQVQPEVYEDEDFDSVTPFEEAVDNLGKELRGDASWFQDEEGSPINEYLYRVDKLSGIGSYGLLLFGFDDGKMLYEPVEGMVSYKPTKNNYYAQSVSALDPKELEYAKKYFDASGGQRLTVNAPNPSTPGRTLGSDGSGVIPIAALDTQFVGVQLGPTEFVSTTPSTKPLKILFIRPFDQSQVQVTQWEANIRSPRFGQPIMYRITLHDWREQTSGIGMPMATVQVHWTRVLHVADNLNSSEVLGVSRLRPVLNAVLDVRKVRGADAEGFYKGGFPGLSIETHPQLGGDVLIDEPSMKNMIENYQNTLQRFLLLMGASAKTLAPAVVDPTPHVNVLIEAICIQLGCPVRVFRGSERGELASSQDDSSWNDRIRHRQNNYLTPRLIVPFYDRLIMAGVLPEPKKGKEKPATNHYGRPYRNALEQSKADSEAKAADKAGKGKNESQGKGGYSVRWPDLDSLSEKDKAGIALQETQALAAYTSGGLDSMIAPKDWWVEVMKRDEERAEALVQSGQDHVEESIGQHGDLAELGEEHDLQPTPPPGFENKPEPPPPLPGMPGGPPQSPFTVRPGEKAVHPQTGETIAQGNPVPKPQGAAAKFHAKKSPTGNEGIEDRVERMLNSGTEWISFPVVFNQEEVSNAFCPTGVGGGIDPSCSPKGDSVLREFTGSDKQKSWAKEIKDRALSELSQYLERLGDRGEEEKKLMMVGKTVMESAVNSATWIDYARQHKGDRLALMIGEVVSKTPKAQFVPPGVRAFVNKNPVTNCGGEGSGVPGPCPSAHDALKAVSDEFVRGSGSHAEMHAKVHEITSGMSSKDLKEAAEKFGSRSAKGRQERVEGIKRFISDRREMYRRAQVGNEKGASHELDDGEDLQERT